jgi:hypothetical protein
LSFPCRQHLLEVRPDRGAKRTVGVGHSAVTAQLTQKQRKAASALLTGVGEARRLGREERLVEQFTLTRMLRQPTQTGRHSQPAQSGRRHAALNASQIPTVVGGAGYGVTERCGKPLAQPAWHNHVDRRRLAVRGRSTPRNDHTKIGERRAIVQAVAAQEALHRLLPRHRRSTSFRFTTRWPCPLGADGAGRVVATAVRAELHSDRVVELALLQECR